MRTSSFFVLASSVIAGCSGTDRVDVGNSVAVSSIADPVAVSSVAQPISVSGIAQAVAVSGIGSPVAISSVDAPIAVIRPELDPDHIESGTESSGTPISCYPFTCQEIATGPFVLTDALLSGSMSVTLIAGASVAAPRWQISVYNENHRFTGARFAVRTGEKLYLQRAGDSGDFAWSGFRP